jgi:hypothetical protein
VEKDDPITINYHNNFWYDVGTIEGRKLVRCLECLDDRLYLLAIPIFLPKKKKKKKPKMEGERETGYYKHKCHVILAFLALFHPCKIAFSNILS